MKIDELIPDKNEQVDIKGDILLLAIILEQIREKVNTEQFKYTTTDIKEMAMMIFLEHKRRLAGAYQQKPFFQAMPIPDISILKGR